MPNQLSVIAPYIAPSLLQELLANPYLPQQPTRKHFQAAALFADISGFTPLTEKLAEMGQEGPEELSRLLNHYFEVMNGLVEAQGGDIVKFGGDAMAVLFPVGDEPASHAVRRAVQAAEAMQTQMGAFASLETSIGTIDLTMTIGLGVGEVQTMQVGGVQDRWEYLVVGDALKQMHRAEKQAESGQIVLSPEAEELIHPEPLVPRPLIQPDWPTMVEEGTAQLSDVLRSYVTNSIAAWLDRTLHSWLGELRGMSVLFISLTQLDYDHKESLNHLHNFLRYAQETIYSYEGTLGRISYTSDRTGLLILFGAPPFAHEDDALRAARCALDLANFAAENDPYKLSMGVATGSLFVGPVGGSTRREYTVMGDAVNLAARLMVMADKDNEVVLCDDETYRQAYGRLTFEPLPPRRVKGKAGLLPIYRPSYEGVVLQRRVLRPTTQIVGRASELALLNRLLDELETTVGQTVVISGEAGIGKSRLVAALTDELQTRGYSTLLGAGQSIARQSSYRAWRDVFNGYFELDETSDLASRQEQVQRVVAEVAPDQLERLPLLNDILTLGFAENDLTRLFDPRLRQQNLIQLVITLLRAWVQERPLVLIIEDVHWLDSLSWALTVQVARIFAGTQTPLLFVLNTRPVYEGNMAQQQLNILEALPATETIQLELLPDAAITELVTAQLQLPNDGLPAAVEQFVQQKANGNPFFAEEMAITLQERGFITIETINGESRCVVTESFANETRTLPDTLQGLVLARIDRLTPEQQLVLKTAAVLGRSFAYTPLHYTLTQTISVLDERLKEHLLHLVQLDFTPIETLEPELRYLFKHIITQETAYNTLLFEQRRTLHQTVAQWYEQEAEAFGEDINPYLPLLVYHYRYANQAQKEAQFAVKAAEQAAAQYANAEAIEYYKRMLELVDTAEEILLPGEVQLFAVRTLTILLIRVGQYDDAIAHSQIIISLAQRHDDVNLIVGGYQMWGDVLRLRRQFAAAQEQVERGLSIARKAEHKKAEVHALIGLGLLFMDQGQLEIAKEHFKQSLAISHEVDYERAIGVNLNNLGIVAEHQREYETAQQHYLQSLEIKVRNGDKRGEGVTLSNLGHMAKFDEEPAKAQDYLEQAITLLRVVGDRPALSMTLGHLGSLMYDFGDFESATVYLQEALDLFQELGQLRGESDTFDLLGILATYQGSYDSAKAYLDHALAVRQNVGIGQETSRTLNLLGALAVAQQDYLVAESYYQQALGLRQGEDAHILLEDWAGLAWAKAAQNDLAGAQPYTEHLLAHLRESPRWSGTCNPIRAYYFSWQTLNALDQDADAQWLLTQVAQAMQNYRDKIGDPMKGEIYLTRPHHKTLWDAWMSRTN